MSAWQNRWRSACNLFASFSKDRSTKVAALCINKHDHAVASGWNGFPRGCDDTIECRHTRPLKYKWTEHAERNAIYNAARSVLEGTTMYINNLFPCTDCARAIIQCGIKEIVCAPPDYANPNWGEDFKVSMEMLCEARVKVTFWEKEVPQDVQ